MDDKCRLWTGRSGAHEWRTADPLGCARDDKKERTVARKGRLLDERAVAEPRHCLNPIWAADVYMQPEFYSAKRASKQSTSYILKRPVAPLIWTTLAAVPSGLNADANASHSKSGERSGEICGFRGCHAGSRYLLLSSADSMAAVTCGESGVTAGSNRSTGLPLRSKRNLVKFHLISPPICGLTDLSVRKT